MSKNRTHAPAHTANHSAPTSPPVSPPPVEPQKGIGGEDVWLLANLWRGTFPQVDLRAEKKAARAKGSTQLAKWIDAVRERLHHLALLSLLDKIPDGPSTQQIALCWLLKDGRRAISLAIWEDCSRDPQTAMDAYSWLRDGAWAALAPLLANVVASNTEPGVEWWVDDSAQEEQDIPLLERIEEQLKLCIAEYRTLDGLDGGDELAVLGGVLQRGREHESEGGTRKSLIHLKKSGEGGSPWISSFLLYQRFTTPGQRGMRSMPCVPHWTRRKAKSSNCPPLAC